MPDIGAEENKSYFDQSGKRIRDQAGMPEFSQQEKDLAKKLLKDVNARRESEDFKQFIKDIETNRMYARGTQHDDGGEGLVRANLIHPELKKSVNETYAKNPDFEILPSESIDEENVEGWKAFGKALEI